MANPKFGPACRWQPRARSLEPRDLGLNLSPAAFLSLHFPICKVGVPHCRTVGNKNALVGLNGLVFPPLWRALSGLFQESSTRLKGQLTNRVPEPDPASQSPGRLAETPNPVPRLSVRSPGAFRALASVEASLAQPSHLTEAGRGGDGARGPVSPMPKPPRPSHPSCTERKRPPTPILYFSGDTLLHVAGEDPRERLQLQVRHLVSGLPTV